MAGHAVDPVSVCYVAGWWLREYPAFPHLHAQPFRWRSAAYARLWLMDAPVTFGVVLFWLACGLIGWAIADLQELLRKRRKCGE